MFDDFKKPSIMAPVPAVPIRIMAGPTKNQYKLSGYIIIFFFIHSFYAWTIKIVLNIISLIWVDPSYAGLEHSTGEGTETVIGRLALNKILACSITPGIPKSQVLEAEKATYIVKNVTFITN